MNVTDVKVGDLLGVWGNGFGIRGGSKPLNNYTPVAFEVLKIGETGWWVKLDGIYADADWGTKRVYNDVSYNTYLLRPDWEPRLIKKNEKLHAESATMFKANEVKVGDRLGLLGTETDLAGNCPPYTTNPDYRPVDFEVLEVGPIGWRIKLDGEYATRSWADTTMHNGTAYRTYKVYEHWKPLFIKKKKVRCPRCL